MRFHFIVQNGRPTVVPHDVYPTIKADLQKAKNGYELRLIRGGKGTGGIKPPVPASGEERL